MPLVATYLRNDHLNITFSDFFLFHNFFISDAEARAKQEEDIPTVSED